jgi:hypothetical protein
MKRPIIKTKPERPYRIARLILLLLVLLLGATLAYIVVWPRVHAMHAGASPLTTVQQDFAFFPGTAKPPSSPHEGSANANLHQGQRSPYHRRLTRPR